VEYGRLLDIGREVVDAKVKRRWFDRAQRLALSRIVPYPTRFARLLWIAQRLRFLLPEALAKKVPIVQAAKTAWPQARHARQMILFDGCVQSVTAPVINLAAARLLDHQGVSPLRAANTGCCGALDLHMSDRPRARQFARANIDAWWPMLEAGAEAIVITASGCASVLGDYGDLLKDDPVYAEKAKAVTAAIKDVAEVVETDSVPAAPTPRRVAFHSPCTLQHHLQIRGRVEALLSAGGFDLAPVRDAHLCCGSAGSYSVTQPKIARKLRDRKLSALTAGEPESIVTANIGCLMHLAGGANVPVQHWVQLLAENLPKS
jgi:glycolate oxidase iron-sulfur subunit